MRGPSGVWERWKNNPGVDEAKNGENDDKIGEKSEARHDGRDRGENEITTEEGRSEKDEFKRIAELALAIVAVLISSLSRQSPEGKQFAQVAENLAPTRSQNVPSTIRITSLPEAGSVPSQR